MKLRVSVYDFLVNFQENLDHVTDLASELASKSSLQIWLLNLNLI